MGWAGGRGGMGVGFRGTVGAGTEGQLSFTDVCHPL